MPLILGTNSIKDTGYDVANSCRFNDGSSDYLTFTPSGNGNRKVFTVSVWVKRANLGINSNIIGSSDNGFGNGFFIQFQSGDNLRVGFQDPNQFKATNRLFRDVSAWYNIVVAVDVTQSSNSDKIKIYVNGVQETSFSTDNTITNADKNFNNTQAHSVGRAGTFDLQYFDGYLAEVVNIDGSQLDPTSFGEFDSDSPTIWKPKDVSGLTFGTNGFYLDFENSSSLGADVSGNGNNFTVNNLTSVDQSTDTCTNNFATLNPLNGNNYAGLTFSEGNLKVTTTAGQYAPAQSTIGFNTGKWYAEFKATDVDNWTMVGIVGQNATATSQPVGYFSDGYGYIGGSSAGGSNSKMNNNSASSYASTYADGDIISVAVDCDNNKLYFGLNGTWLNSGNPESGSSGTGAAFTISSSPTSGFYHFAVGNWSGSQTPDWEANFGSPPYAISSGNSDAEGFGNFEYAVPSGYFALCSKNLAEYG